MDTLNNYEKEIVETTSKSDIVEIPIKDIRSNPHQPREYFDEESLRELSESIKDHGIIEPIIVKKSIKGYDLVAGERRTKAAKLAGLKTIPAINGKEHTRIGNAPKIKTNGVPKTPKTPAIENTIFSIIPNHHGIT
jgi:hypothetical protein